MGDGQKHDADDESWTDVGDGGPDLVEAVPIRQGMVLAGRYAVEKIIGRGGSGVVVRANDRDLQQDVAIKIVRAELAGQRMWAARLAREVKLARQIQHPHVCRVFDFEQAEGRAFLVMELAEHDSLREEIRSGVLAARPLAARIADARAVASALSAIHAAGIVHRDVTPQNLLRMGDGRLVLSDFGLATDASERTTVHGGTVAYMAPEVVRGGHASVASDIWALGAVMHELVFGAKPRWSDASEMLAPELGRKLTEEERAVLDACRACTAKEPSRRLARATDAARLLTEPQRWWARPLPARRPFVWAAALALVAAGVVAVVRTPRKAQPSPFAESPLIVPTGAPADWTDVSKVLVELPELIECTRVLADQRTLRFVVGTPRRAEDLDTMTGQRTPSPLVPAAYAEGCPDLSSDGKRLVFPGHTADGRAFAFLSQHADGRDAVALVPTAEPSLLSEPTWFSDNDTFSFDIDTKHMAVFSVESGQMKVLPAVTTKPFATAFRYVNADRIFIGTIFDTGETEFAELSMPGMKEGTKFRVPPVGRDFTPAGPFFYYTHQLPGRFGEVVQVDASTQRARALGRLRDQSIRHPKFLPDRLVFVARQSPTSIAVETRGGPVRTWKTKGEVHSAARCGPDIVVANEHNGQMTIERLGADGRFLATLTPGPWDAAPDCSPDGKVLFFLRQKIRPAVVRCDRAGCRSIIDRQAMNLAVSADGKRLVFVATDGAAGPMVVLADADGGRVRELAQTETGCQPGWASNDRVWVSRRRGGKIVWMEIEVASGAETGRSVVGSRDCSDGRLDPRSPVHAGIRVIDEQISQIRSLERRYVQ